MSDTPSNPPETREPLDEEYLAPKKLTTAASLRALAHPVRMAIIEHLTVVGPLTATELSDRLDESPANCSWHLRKLAEHGIVEEAPSGPGRRRPWKMSRIGLSFDDFHDDNEAERASNAFMSVVSQRALDRFHEAADHLADIDGEWARSSDAIQNAMWVTKQEYDEVLRDLHDVIMRHRERIIDKTRIPDGAELVEFVAFAAPLLHLKDSFVPDHEATSDTSPEKGSPS